METPIVSPKKNNLPLIIALCIPALMIILVAAFVYLPGLGKRPTHNFLYMTGNTDYYGYYGTQIYQVSGGHLVKNPAPTPVPGSQPPYIKPDNTEPNFYIYNVSTESATEVTFEQAQALTLDSSNLSDDGYVIEQGNYRGGDFIFGGGGGDYNSWFIKGHNRSIKLKLKLTGPSYYNFRFLGWVK